MHACAAKVCALQTPSYKCILERHPVACVLGAEVVEYACGIAPDLMGEIVENVSTGIDTYSLRQPLGVSEGEREGELWGRESVAVGGG